MFRQLFKLLGLCLLLSAGVAGVWYYQWQNSAQQTIAELKIEKQQLEQIVERLSTERRIAQVLVTDQSRDPTGVLETTLLFVEESRDGRTLPPRQVTVRGDHAYIDAMVVKFDQSFIKAGDVLRGQSIALFDKIFGSAQKPDEASRIDEPGRIPEIYRGSSAQVSRFEQNLWSQFWSLVRDPEYAKSQGVRVAHGQSVYGPFEPGKLYTLSIDPNGNINLASQPVPAVYREWMKNAHQK